MACLKRRQSNFFCRTAVRRAFSLPRATRGTTSVEMVVVVACINILPACLAHIHRARCRAAACAAPTTAAPYRLNTRAPARTPLRSSATLTSPASCLSLLLQHAYAYGG